MILEHLKRTYQSVKSSHLFGRYITNGDIELCLNDLPKSMIGVEGFSVEKRPIYSLRFGTGSKKVLMWSQMHGNESTTTKALFDCFNFFLLRDKVANKILDSCSITVIPILNPDGAERYTRLNANKIDLNRDAQHLSQPESIILNNLFNSLKPDYCFNLHGQRTMYNVGDSKKSSVLSYLSPSQDEERTITANRKIAMHVISAVSNLLQNEIPNGVARYDDAFNLNCVGDTFQNLGTPTLLYEAGHFPNDYNREVVRRLMFIAIITGLNEISKEVGGSQYLNYFEIPENKKLFFDIIIRNVSDTSMEDGRVDVGINYEERLINKKIEFIPVISSISNLSLFFGHKEINANGFMVSKLNNNVLTEGCEIDFVLINNEKISLKP